MKHISTLLFLLIPVLSSFGQNYQTVRSNGISYFEDDDNYVSCIRIDSVKSETDSVLYPFAVIQEIGDGCYSPYAASWIGSRVIVKESGENLFFNKNNDTIIIKTQAVVGDTWNAYNVNDSLIVKANVTAHDTMTILGLADSVKTIEFQAYNGSMDSMDNSINGLSIKISKNYGIVQTLNFYLFPGFEGGVFPYLENEEYSLVGLSNPEVGLQNLTWFDINDFQVGDEIHVLYESLSNGSTITEFYKKTICKYLERTDYSDSIVYTYYLKESVNDTSVSEDTVTTTIKADSLFDRLPCEPYVSDSYVSSLYMINASILTKVESSGEFTSTTESCWEELIDDANCSYSFEKGLGGPYYSCDGVGGAVNRSLVYYKKSDVTWGTELNITAISEVDQIKNISFYPNPANDIIYLNFENSNYSNYCINIYNIEGRLLKSEKVEATDLKLEVSDLPGGIYFMKIASGKETVQVDKLIIE